MIVSGDGDQELVKVVDFGIAKILGREEGAQQLTQTGEVFGSPLFMSPEQCQGLDLDGRSDIYSLGCIMYKVLVGVYPFQGGTPLLTILQHLSDRAQPFTVIRPDLQFPPELERYVIKTLEKKAEDRYQNALELKADLQKLASRAPEGR